MRVREGSFFFSGRFVLGRVFRGRGFFRKVVFSRKVGRFLWVFVVALRCDV